jgi:predicted Zn-dependent protease
MLKEKRYSNETAARYELVSALLRARRFKEAEVELRKLPAGKGADPMLLQLAADSALAAGNQALALQRYQLASSTYPGYRPLQYGYIGALLTAGRSGDALALADKQLALYPLDRRLWKLDAQAHAKLGHRLLSYRAEAEATALSGNLVAAVELINQGLKAGDGSFYDMSAAEARRREWESLEKLRRKNEASNAQR